MQVNTSRTVARNNKVNERQRREHVHLQLEDVVVVFEQLAAKRGYEPWE
jgi:hypothetical protein